MSIVEQLLQHVIDGLPDRQFSVERVHYAPGEIDVAHHHTAPLVVYVVDGALLSRMGDARARGFHLASYADRTCLMASSYHPR
jgi:quercetin dioxygenase-like cupin family protein